MKLMLLAAVLAGAFGMWAGFSGWQSGTVRTTVHGGLALLVGGNLLICSWAWWRSKPGSGDAMVLPTLALLSGGLLASILPRLLWPSSEVVHLVGSTASAVIVTATVIVQFRKRRWLRNKVEPV